MREMILSGTSRNLDATGINDIAQLLFRVVDVERSPRQSEELIDEMSQLLRTISNLDPDMNTPLKHSGLHCRPCHMGC
jgi:hypothetical protein